MYRTNNTRGNVANFALLVGALLSGIGVAVACAARSARRTQRQHVEKYRDKALKDTFPASDPPASQYFDIPVNRL